MLVDGEPGPVLPDVRGAGGRRGDQHGRGPGRRRPAVRPAAVVQRPARAAVRVLHPGLPHAGRGLPGASATARTAPSRPRPRSANWSRPTCAGAPAIRASSRRCWPPRGPGGSARPGRGRHDRLGTRARGVIGARVPRKEDPRLLRGRGRFGADMSRPGQVWARIVRSPIAHGRLRAVHTAQAAAAPGVVAVVTAADLPGRAGDPGPARRAGHRPERLPAAGAGRRHGALRRRAAGRGAGRRPVPGRGRGRTGGHGHRRGSPAVLDAAGGTVAADFTLGYGDVAAAFARADHVVRDRGPDRPARRGAAGAAHPAGRP